MDNKKTIFCVDINHLIIPTLFINNGRFIKCIKGIPHDSKFMYFLQLERGDVVRLFFETEQHIGEIIIPEYISIEDIDNQ